MEEFCRSQEKALRELEKVAPGVPFLALGQTVFWDEPMKAGVVQACRRLGIDRPFVSGIHDTDYFAKYPHKELRSGFAALPHNDTDTQALWSAAGEFSALFGSETVVTREKLASAGGKVGMVAELRPGYLDEITEAWGWRGVVSYGRKASTTSEMPMRRLFKTLYETFDWAITTSQESVVGGAQTSGDALRALVCDSAEDFESLTLAEFYRRLAPKMFDLAAGEPLDLEATRTTELLRFNRDTCRRDRFRMVDLFLRPDTRQKANAAYDKTVDGSQMYTLDRFGVGALPFDLLIPGVGRGTLRLGSRGGLVMAEHPVGFSYKKRPESVEELAAVLEKRFGADVVLVGKAVTLVGMLAAEFVFVFHEGASGYIPMCREFHRLVEESRLHPILRVKYDPWSALSQADAWLRLPEPFRRAFGAEELSAGSFARRWPKVADEQGAVLKELSRLRRPLELIRYLNDNEGGHWSCLATEYQEMHEGIASLRQKVDAERSRRKKTIKEWKRLRRQRTLVEAKIGKHWREKLFGKDATKPELEKRKHYQSELAELREEIERLEQEWSDSVRKQESLVTSKEVEKMRERRKAIAFEAELMRMKLIREAVLSADGLTKAGRRPSAWWFPLVSPDGAWARATLASAEYYLEPLV